MNLTKAHHNNTYAQRCDRAQNSKHRTLLRPWGALPPTYIFVSISFKTVALLTELRWASVPWVRCPAQPIRNPDMLIDHVVLCDNQSGDSMLRGRYLPC